MWQLRFIIREICSDVWVVKENLGKICGISFQTICLRLFCSVYGAYPSYLAFPGNFYAFRSILTLRTLRASIIVMRTQYLFLPCILALFWNKSTAAEPYALNKLVCTWTMSHWFVDEFSHLLCTISRLSFLRCLLFRCPKAAAGTYSRKFAHLLYPAYGWLLWYEAGKSVGEILKYGLSNESYWAVLFNGAVF